MHAMGVVMIQENENLLQRLESYLSNPLQPFDYSLMQEAYNEIAALHKSKQKLLDTISLLNESKENLLTTINIVGNLNLKLEEQYKNAVTKGNDLVTAMLSGSDSGWDAAIDDWYNLDLISDWKNEYLESLRYRKQYKQEADHWRQATYHLAHMLSKLDGGADADKFAVEAYEATSTCYCEPENQIYCHIHW